MDRRQAFMQLLNQAVWRYKYFKETDFVKPEDFRKKTGTLIVETMPEHEMQWADRIRSLSPYMPLFISTLHPKRMAKYVWPDMRDDASVARQHS